MKCDDPNIPEYLHWNARNEFSPSDFFYYHKLYRRKPNNNPLEIPAAWVTAISCRWSRIVKKKHITHPADSRLGDDYNFVFVKKVRRYKLVKTYEDPHEYNGVHVLTCEIFHRPNNCDYSHSEILIRHRIFQNGEQSPMFDEVYTHESWENKTALLKKLGGRFFKDLKSDFRLEMIKLISIPSSKNNAITDLKAVLGIEGN